MCLVFFNGNSDLSFVLTFFFSEYRSGSSPTKTLPCFIQPVAFIVWVLYSAVVPFLETRRDTRIMVHYNPVCPLSFYFLQAWTFDCKNHKSANRRNIQHGARQWKNLKSSFAKSPQTTHQDKDDLTNAKSPTMLPGTT